jgi:GT2 family glycosyltransferase
VRSPAVSILIPVYNGRAWIASAIESALAQTCPGIEVFVLDDGSTDGSIEVIRRYDGRARIETQANRGQNVSRNRLTAMSSGDWLVYLDADDTLAADAVERKLECAAGADSIYGSIDLEYYQGSELVRSEVFPALDHPDMMAAAFHWKLPNTSAFMIRRSAVIDVGGWNERIRSCTDYDLHFRMLLAGKRLAPAPKSRSVYRFWSSSQASAEDALRLTATRLAVMWNTVAALNQSNGWTPASRAAFGNAALGVIRILHQLDPDQAAKEYARLRAEIPDLQPSPELFASTYRAALRLVGFRGAEWIADATRFVRPRPLPVVTH